MRFSLVGSRLRLVSGRVSVRGSLGERVVSSPHSSAVCRLEVQSLTSFEACSITWGMNKLTTERSLAKEVADLLLPSLATCQHEAPTFSRARRSRCSARGC